MTEPRDRLAPYEAALSEAISERDRIETAELPQAREFISTLEVRKDRLDKLIETLLMLLPPDRRIPFYPKIERRLDEPTGRNGVVYSNVIHLFRHAKNRDWTPPAVLEALTVKGIQETKSQLDLFAFSETKPKGNQPLKLVFSVRNTGVSPAIVNKPGQVFRYTEKELSLADEAETMDKLVGDLTKIRGENTGTEMLPNNTWNFEGVASEVDETQYVSFRNGEYSIYVFAAFEYRDNSLPIGIYRITEYCAAFKKSFDRSYFCHGHNRTYLTR